MIFPEKLTAGSQLDSYRIEAPVAQSGMATIFRATDLRDHHTVALKVPHPDMEADPILFDRFLREAGIGERLNHPGVMRVISERDHSRPYIVMEWCDGRPLRQLMNEERIPRERVIRIAVRVLETLEYVHANGIVHRDLKPENIVLEPGDAIKIIDFGIASDAASRRLTYANFTPTLGTPDYISPELVKGQRGDGRSDIYAVGVMLYEMLTGKLPFSGPSALAVMNDRVRNHPIPPRVADPTISPQLQEVLYRALERDPHNRYARAQEFRHDLEHLDQVGVDNRAELRDWRRRKPRRRSLVLYASLLAIPLALLLLMLLLAQRQ